MKNPYTITYKGMLIDPYRILHQYGITHPAQQHAIKKLLRAGRSHKQLHKDIQETIQTLERWLEMLNQDEEKPPC
jgi:lipid II:glycine glycyltransferase (peptidoglycan interpeptide bridge formation enzyme)